MASKHQYPFFIVWRDMAIMAIVAHHCVCAMQGGFPPGSALSCTVPDAISCMSLWLKRFGMVSFVFISGWFAFRSLSANKSLIQFIKSKISRILVPCAIFAMLYYVLFPQFMYFESSPVNGTHLWYLPMIFLCFINVVFVKRANNRNVIYGLLVVAIIEMALLLLTRYLPQDPTWRTVFELKKYWPIFVVGYYCSSINAISRCASHEFPLPGILSSISTTSFGIYLVHQFIVNALALHPIKFNALLLLPLLFTVVFVFSYLVVEIYGRSRNAIGSRLKHEP